MKTLLLAALTATLLFPLKSLPSDAGITEFESDGCSFYPDGAGAQDGLDWSHCCFVHDIRYWMGGTWGERLNADIALKACVSEATNPYHGELMYRGVRAGGHPRSELPWRWGFGFEKLRDYRVRDRTQNQSILLKAYSVENEIFYWSLFMSAPQEEYVQEAYLRIMRHL